MTTPLDPNGSRIDRADTRGTENVEQPTASDASERARARGPEELGRLKQEKPQQTGASAVIAPAPPAGDAGTNSLVGGAAVRGAGAGGEAGASLDMASFWHLAETTSSKENPVVHNPVTQTYGASFAPMVGGVLAHATEAQLQSFHTLKASGVDDMAAAIMARHGVTDPGPWNALMASGVGVDIPNTGMGRLQLVRPQSVVAALIVATGEPEAAQQRFVELFNDSTTNFEDYSESSSEDRAYRAMTAAFLAVGGDAGRHQATATEPSVRGFAIPPINIAGVQLTGKADGYSSTAPGLTGHGEDSLVRSVLSSRDGGREALHDVGSMLKLSGNYAERAFVGALLLRYAA